MHCFEYLSPESLDAAIGLIRSRENIAVLAGGTDFIPLMKQGLKRSECLLDLGRVQELKETFLRGNDLFIGSMVTLAGLVENPIVRMHIPALAESAVLVASPQIRNQGTVGGNLLQARRCSYFNQSDSWRANLSPCFGLGGSLCHQVPSSSSCRALYYSDLAPVLLAFDAAAEVLDEKGMRTVSLQSVIHSHVSGEGGKFLLKGISVPVPAAGTWGKFMKQSLRSAFDFPVANAALRYSPEGTKQSADPLLRIYVGAMSPEPFSLDETAKEFSGGLLDARDLAKKALEEAGRKSAAIRETGVAPAVKKGSLKILQRLCEELTASLPR